MRASSGPRVLALAPASADRAARWWVLLATLFAAVVRFVALDRLPPPAWYDEVWFALRARELLASHQLHAFYPTDFGGANAGLVYLTALAQLLGLGGITVARVAPAVLGVVAVPATYACMRRLLEPELPGQARPVAVLAAWFTACLASLVILSRVGMEPAMAPTAAVLAVWQLLRGLRGRAASGWLLAGLITGLAQYNGPHARLLLPLLVYVVVDQFARGDGPERRRVTRGSLVLAATLLLVTMPLSAFFVRHPEWLLARTQGVSAELRGQTARGSLAPLARNTLRTIAAFNFRGDANPRHGLPGRPILDGLQSLGFWLGLAWAARHLRRGPSARILLVWLVLAALPAAVTDEAPNIGRMIGVTPPALTLCAIGWVLAWAWLRRRTRTGVTWRSPRGLAGLAVVVVLASLVGHTWAVFAEWPRSAGMAREFMSAPTAFARDLARRAAAGPLIMTKEDHGDHTIAFDYYLQGATTRRLIAACLPLPHNASLPVTYVADRAEDQEALTKLQAVYGDDLVQLGHLDHEDLHLTAVEVPAGTPTRLEPGGPVARFAGLELFRADLPAQRLAPGEEVVLDLCWHVTTPPAEALTTFIHLLVGPTGETIVAQNDGQPCSGELTTDQWPVGSIVCHHVTIRLPPTAPAGRYRVVAGWYGAERLPLVEAGRPLPDHRAIVGEITVGPGD